MAIDVKKILRKKKPKGSEIGQLLILSTLAGANNSLFTQDEYDNMVKSIDNEKDVMLYNTYLNIHNHIIQSQAALEVFKQQALHGYANLNNAIQEATSYESARRTIAEFPLIMTDKQYEELRQQALDEQRNITITYFGLMFHCIDYFTGEFTEKIPKPPEPLKIALENLKTQVMKNEDILNIICRVWNLGYYVLPDGRKSNELKPEEYNKELEKLLNEKTNGEINIDKYWFYDIEENNITIKHDTWINIRIARELELEFVCDYEPLKNYSKYDVLFGDYNITSTISGEVPDSKISPVELFFLFKNEFSELYYTLKNYLGNRKGLDLYRTAANELDIFEKTITWGELADNRIMNFRYYMGVSDRDILDMIEKDKDFNCGVKNGIAIIRDPEDNCLDENGYYNNTKLDFADNMFRSVSAFYDNDTETHYLRDTREQLYISALQDIFAYNIYFDTLADEIGIEELKRLKADEEFFSLQAADLNEKASALAKSISKAYSGGGHKHLLMLKTIFPHIDIESIKPSEEKILSFKKELKDINIFNEPVRLARAIYELKNSSNADNGGDVNAR